MGTTYSELIYENAGGISGGGKLLAFAPSGPSSGFLPASMSTLPLDWENPGMLVYYSQKLMFFLGWNKGEILTLRSRLIAESQRGGTGARPTLNALSKEIDTTVQIVSGKADNAEIANIYVYHDRQDPAFGGVESIQKNAQALSWPADAIVSQVQPYPDPDLGIVRELCAAT
jgi:hypothetical protein